MCKGHNHYSWFFNLHKHLTLNLTLKHFYFSSGHDFQSGRLVVYRDTCKNKRYCYNRLLHCVAPEDFTLYGQHSKYHIFPQFKDVTVSMVWIIRKMVHVDTEFSVLDNNIIYSHVKHGHLLLMSIRPSSSYE